MIVMWVLFVLWILLEGGYATYTGPNPRYFVFGRGLLLVIIIGCMIFKIWGAPKI